MSGNDNDLFDPSGSSALIGGDHLHIINEALEQINSSVTNDLSRPLRFRRHSSNQIINDSTTFLGPLMSNLIDYNSMNVPRRHPRVRIRQIPPVRRTRSTTTLRPGSTRFRLGPLESMLDRLGPTGGNDHTSLSSLLQGIGPLGNIFLGFERPCATVWDSDQLHLKRYYLKKERNVSRTTVLK